MTVTSAPRAVVDIVSSDYSRGKFHQTGNTSTVPVRGHLRVNGRWRDRLPEAFVVNDGTHRSERLDMLRELLLAGLRKRGILVKRSDVGFLPALSEYLDRLTERRFRPDVVLSYDTDATVQYELILKYGERVWASSTLSCPSNLLQDESCTLIEIDGEAFDTALLEGEADWIFVAEVIIVRTSLGYFWAGSGDLVSMKATFEGRGFLLSDVLGHVNLQFQNGLLGQIFFVFERKSHGIRKEDLAKRLSRVEEAHSYLNRPIARSDKFSLLAGRKSLGFSSGVLNPGAVLAGDKFTLLARGENIPWAVSRSDARAFFADVRPLVIELDGNLSVCANRPLTLERGGNSTACRFEDFRLFRYQGELFTNHSIYSPSDGMKKDGSVEIKSLELSVGISSVNLDEGEMRFLGRPKIDAPIQEREKNWVYFEYEKNLYLIYSFRPYRIFRANRWPDLSFQKVCECDIKLPPVFGLGEFRNSANPVDYNADYFLHVVHRVFSGLRYVFWAVLIEKKTLLPAMISARPLVCGWHSVPASIIYVVSVVVRGDDILVFAGIDDCASGVWRISRADLDSNWIPINSATVSEPAH